MAFILTVLSDTIRLAPCTFRKQTMTALKDEINLKFSNKVLCQIESWVFFNYSRKVMIHTGLCICLYDILYCGKALIKYGDGCAYIPGYKEIKESVKPNSWKKT